MPTPRPIRHTHASIKKDIKKSLEKIKKWREDAEKQKSKRYKLMHKPGEFNGASFLYIRADEDDIGIRPADQPWWHSPDLNILDNNANNSVTTQIEAGKQYTIQCTVRNGGDFDVPSATVEFFLCKPSLGRYVSTSRHLGIHSVTVNAFSSSIINQSWVAGVEDEGHRCLIARVFSFSPMDVPEDWEYLDTPNDRHIGQQNLTVIQSGESLTMEAFPLKKFKKSFRLVVLPMKSMPQNVKCSPSLKKITNISAGSSKSIFEVKPVNPRQLILRKSGTNIWNGQVRGKGDMAEMEIKVPNLRLKKNEGKSFQVMMFHPRKRKPSGGFTILVTG